MGPLGLAKESWQPRVRILEGAAFNELWATLGPKGMVAHCFGILSVNSGLLEVIVAHDFQLLGFPGRPALGSGMQD